MGGDALSGSEEALLLKVRLSSQGPFSVHGRCVAPKREIKVIKQFTGFYCLSRDDQYLKYRILTPIATPMIHEKI